MTEQEKEQYIEYAYSIQPPAEAEFFTIEQLRKLKDEKLKAINTQKFLENIIEAEDFDDKFQKATIEGRIYSPSQYAGVFQKNPGDR